MEELEDVSPTEEVVGVTAQQNELFEQQRGELMQMFLKAETYLILLYPGPWRFKSFLRCFFGIGVFKLKTQAQTTSLSKTRVGKASCLVCELKDPAWFHQNSFRALHNQNRKSLAGRNLGTWRRQKLLWKVAHGKNWRYSLAAYQPLLPYRLFSGAPLDGQPNVHSLLLHHTCDHSDIIPGITCSHQTSVQQLKPLSQTTTYLRLNMSSGGAKLNTKNIQGDVILGLQKRVEAFLFFVLKDDRDSTTKFRQVLKASIVPLVTSTQGVTDSDAQIKSEKQKNPNVVLPITHLNIAFSARGLIKLGISVNDLPGQSSDAFHSTQRSDAITNLGDPMDLNTRGLKTWSPDYLRSELDGIILLTAPDNALLEKKLSDIQKILTGLTQFSFVRKGNVRPGEAANHEHFGYLDGISAPQIKGFNDDNGEGKNVGIVGPEVILLGQPGSQPPLTPSRAWMKDGSFLVIRELQQLVPEFDQFVVDLAQKSGVAPGLIGARIVGRWKSGAPVVLADQNDNPSLARSQAFDFSNDLQQHKCPYAAHVRKTNPRAGIEGADRNTAVNPHLIVRSGIPYGPELTEQEKQSKKTIHERGLLFVCYQSSIEAGFQRIQKFWSNDTTFPPNPLKVNPGFDLIIGQTSSMQPRTAQNIVPKGQTSASDPNSVVTAMRDFVVPKGGEYFFTPSIDALTNKLGA
ncbi:hypothetical protein O181_017735 [Austropuccinia psidii MF-1]|uniref:Dyp-type peroxidase n=1 Tax=Austropuccinia psidii MF-1 TaxID=1389203 RepID=A0A9Q3C8E2_9BASI|nr:hypothetical protein [Austropuccinia psidii MF-1]